MSERKKPERCRAVVWVTASQQETAVIQQLVQEHGCDGVTYFAEAVGKDIEIDQGYTERSEVYSHLESDSLGSFGLRFIEEIDDDDLLWNGFTLESPPKHFVSWLSREFPEAVFEMRWRNEDSENRGSVAHILVKDGTELCEFADWNPVAQRPEAYPPTLRLDPAKGLDPLDALWSNE